jgi:glucose 1-dehydrogenase
MSHLPKRLADKTALVTGSSSGIGAGIAVRLAQDGASVAINYRNDREGGEKTLADVERVGGHGIILQGDVSKVAEVERLVQEAVHQLGRLDVLVNNAGIEKQQAFVDVDEASYDRVLDVNLKAVFFATQAFARAAIARGGGGKVINISSVHEELPFPGFASYCASKGGVKMLTRDLAVELAPHGITVNGVAPGAIATPINTTLLEDKPKLEALLAQIPLRRLGSPGDVAGVVAFLASADADYITASTVFVDGGLMWNYQEQ